ncbi:MAG: peptide deformylase [Sphingobacterium sp.]|uniref:peptide deformylase n=1 Tax=Sphingobacterium sp. JB170 TaxID=1434842 RepID=UPI00097EE7FC|nr:peptide deformylase [Sphingobacterium sp. JB170]SJN34628.1 Peptide deformylase [Sphingobacterium sp. JB170]
MKYASIILTLLLAAVQTGFAQDDHNEIEVFRENQRRSLEKSAGGPIATENIRFVNYFSFDPEFDVEATVEFLYEEPTIRLPTSDGTSKVFKRFALLHFSLQGNDLSLPVYENASLFQTKMQANYLFFPIMDLTTGDSTYESGRYIDLKRQDIKNGKVRIDFNKAYNPYCAYSNGYRCPQPPKENFINIAIPVGEKKYTGPKNHREEKPIMAKDFTAREKKIILSGEPDEKMYVLQTTLEKDSIILRTQSDDIKFDSPLLEHLTKRMYATVTDPEHPGVGIAAPQVGINKNIICVQRFDKNENDFNYYINPKIVWRSALMRKGVEGCLSIPDMREDVLRNYAIILQYVDHQSGNKVEEIIEGYSAVIFQHEVDHLYGILFPDRLEEQQRAEDATVELNEQIEFWIKKNTILP